MSFNRKICSALIAATALVASAGVQASAILTQTANATGYGLTTSNMTSLRTALTASNTLTQTASFNNLSYMNGFNALWVNDQFSAMASGDMTAVSSFISAGHKAVFITDNNGWASWNNSIETMIGANINDTCASANGARLVTNSLTTNAATLYGSSCNSLINSTANSTMLYSNNMAALYKVGQGEALLITSVDILGSSLYSQNSQFANNIVSWLGQPVNAVPLPSTLLLLGLGLAALGFSRKKAGV